MYCYVCNKTFEFHDTKGNVISKNDAKDIIDNIDL